MPLRLEVPLQREHGQDANRQLAASRRGAEESAPSTERETAFISREKNAGPLSSSAGQRAFNRQGSARGGSRGLDREGSEQSRSDDAGSALAWIFTASSQLTFWAPSTGTLRPGGVRPTRGSVWSPDRSRPRATRDYGRAWAV